MANQNHLDLNNEIMLSVNEAKNILRNTIDPNISIYMIRELNRNTVDNYECDLVFLHLRIIFFTPNDVHHYLENYCNLRGFYATQMFLNYPLNDTENEITITPMETALLWSSDPTMLRVLYRWGANPARPDVHTRFRGQIHQNEIVPYRNYLSRYHLMENIDNHNYNYPQLQGRRIPNEFAIIMEEHDMISGEMPPNIGWVMPERFRPRN